MNWKLLTLYCAALCLIGCARSEAPDSMNSRLSVPYNAAAQAAYDRVSGVAILDPGLQALIEIARSEQPFARRLAEVMNRRIEVVDMYQSEAPDGGNPVLETQFSYAANDLLEGMFMAEIDRLAAGSPSRGDVEELGNMLDRQELGPMWNDHVKPRIRTRLEEVEASG